MATTVERRQLGTILLESGRITQEDVARVLDYQRTHGGFFGQGLVELGIVTREEIDWALASQFDLPFIFPNPDAVDRDAAHLVPADWALAHLAVPIVRVGRSLTVVVADPLRTEVTEDLRARTGCDVEMALASATRIRELIHAVYDAADSRLPDSSAPLMAEEFVTRAAGAAAFGLSVRGTAGSGWWRTGSEMHRAPLADGWQAAISGLMTPPPLDLLPAPDSSRPAPATVQLKATGAAFEMRILPGTGGVELLFRPVRSAGAAAVATTLPESLVTELRLLWRSGSARIGFGSTAPDLARSLLPLLPTLALGQHTRAVHISDGGDSAAPFTLTGVADSSFAGDVSSYEFDAITIDLPPQGYPVTQLLRAAPLTFVLLDEPDDRAAPEEWDMNWILAVYGQPGSYAWDLRARHR